MINERACRISAMINGATGWRKSKVRESEKLPLRVAALVWNTLKKRLFLLHPAVILNIDGAEQSP